MYNKSYLSHHGRMGQKWGKRNGPPYPLDFSKLSKEERAAAKKTAIDDGRIDVAQSNLKYFDTNELEQVIRRYQLDKNMSDLRKQEMEAGWKYVEDTEKKIKTVAGLMSGTAAIYNTTASVANAFGGTDLPILGSKKKKDKE